MVVIKGIDRHGNIVQLQTNDKQAALDFVEKLDSWYYDEPLPDDHEGIKICDRGAPSSLASLDQDDFLGGVRAVPIKGASHG